MQQQYQKNTNIVIDYLVTVGRGRETIRAYKACYRSLSDALEQKGVPYSSGFAALWLEQEQHECLKKTTFSLYKAALHKLHDVYQTGGIQYDNFNPEKVKYARLNKCFRIQIDSFMAANASLSSRTIKGYQYDLCDIFYYFQMMGCTDISDITYEMLFKFCDTLEARTYHVKAHFHSRLNSLLCFLYSEGLVPYGYTLFVTGIAMRKIRFWNSVDPEEIKCWKDELADGKTSYSLGDYLTAGKTVYDIHRQNGYSDSILSSILQAVNLFYLFMDVYSLRYTPVYGIKWAESLRSYVSGSEVSTIRRIMILVGRSTEGITIDLKAVFSTRVTVLQKLPDWCSRYIKAFLKEKEAEHMARNTISMMNSSCCRFCHFLIQSGITSFSQVTSFLVKQFNLTDQHKTPAGKNAYNSRIRRFLIFLAENNVFNNPFLFLALPCVSAPRETFVVVLSQQEQAELRSLFENEADDISLRQKAMLQLGLYMGLRGIDVINLVIDDIDWDDVSIRFIQEKTGYELYLPMPAEVANALYRYIIRERPESDNPRVFLRSKAPYCELETTNACVTALEAALPERNVNGSGFHVTRKTFATNKLRNGADPDEVKELLGHRDHANVHKYLSLDESRMMLCSLDLSERSIKMEGRFGR